MSVHAFKHNTSLILVLVPCFSKPPCCCHLRKSDYVIATLNSPILCWSMELWLLQKSFSREIGLTLLPGRSQSDVNKLNVSCHNPPPPTKKSRTFLWLSRTRKKIRPSKFSVRENFGYAFFRLLTGGECCCSIWTREGCGGGGLVVSRIGSGTGGHGFNSCYLQTFFMRTWRSKNLKLNDG